MLTKMLNAEKKIIPQQSQEALHRTMKDLNTHDTRFGSADGKNL